MRGMFITMLDVEERNWAKSLKSFWNYDVICWVAFTLSPRFFNSRLVASNDTRNDLISCSITFWPFCNVARVDNASSTHGLLLFLLVRARVCVHVTGGEEQKKHIEALTTSKAHDFKKRTPWGRARHRQQERVIALKHSVGRRPTWSRGKRENNIPAAVSCPLT